MIVLYLLCTNCQIWISVIITIGGRGGLKVFSTILVSDEILSIMVSNEN